MTAVKQWKASEFRAWLLFYSLPVQLSGLLPADYIYYLSLLVSAMHILLGDAIKTVDIDTAQSNLSFSTNLFHNSTLPRYALLICTASYISPDLYIVGDHCGVTAALVLEVRTAIFESTAMLQGMYNDPQCTNAQTLPILGKRLANSANPQMAALIQYLTGTISASSSGTEIKGHISHKTLKV